MSTNRGSDAKPLMRCLGEFVGQVWKGVRADPAAGRAPQGERREVRRTVEEEHRPGVVLRRTTIEEIEYPGDAPPSA